MLYGNGDLRTPVVHRQFYVKKTPWKKAFLSGKLEFEKKHAKNEKKRVNSLATAMAITRIF